MADKSVNCNERRNNSASVISSRTGHLLVTSDSLPSRHQFHGYAFERCDFVHGPEGLRSYRSETGKDIGPGLDGCYVVVRPVENGIEIGADFSGNYRLFVYERPNFWAASTSLMRLAREVKNRGLPLHLNRAQLEAWKSPGPLSNQLTSFDTVFQEIRLVPSWLTIVASSDKLEFIPRPYQLDAVGSYQDRLSQYLSIWQGRLRTLYNHSDFRLGVELSGGLDSRAVFCFFSHLLKNGALNSDRISIITSDSELLQADRIVADRVLERLGIERAESAVRPDSFEIDASEALDQWQLTALGQYAPFRKVAQARRNPNIIGVGGGGGEEHRLFYKAPDLRQRIKKMGERFSSQPLYLEYCQSFRAALQTLRETYGETTDVSILHYREFRSRFHSGTRSFNFTHILPLKSVHLRSCTDAMDPDSLENRQLFFDILNSLEPSLLEVPFDTPEKSMNARNRNDLCNVLVPTAELGKVYPSPWRISSPTSKSVTSTTFDKIIEKIEERGVELPTKIISRREVQNAISDCKRLRESGFPRQRESIHVHFILLCIELLDLGLLKAE